MQHPINYIERTRAYYAALGYETPYQWSHNSDIPFSRLNVPLDQTRLALLTTAALYDPDKGDQGPGALYNGSAKFFIPYKVPVTNSPDTRISHIAYDRDHTRADDQNSWLPLNALQAEALAGHIGSVAPHLHGVPTNRSQRVTQEQDAPAILDALQADGTDAAILVANCPVCHQSVTLIARYLEEHGIATVVMGCAKDIVEQAGAPRFVFSDFPLGNAAGKPHDRESQSATLALALELLTTATEPTNIFNEQIWNTNASWKLDYSNHQRLSKEELARRRAAFDAQKTSASRNG